MFIITGTRNAPPFWVISFYKKTWLLFEYHNHHIADETHVINTHIFTRQLSICLVWLTTLRWSRWRPLLALSFTYTCPLHWPYYEWTRSLTTRLGGGWGNNEYTSEQSGQKDTWLSPQLQWRFLQQGIQLGFDTCGVLQPDTRIMATIHGVLEQDWEAC